MCDDSRCFYHDDKELFHRVRSTWTESPNTLDWESCVLKLRVRTRRTGSPEYLDWESGVLGLGVRGTWTGSPEAPDSYPRPSWLTPLRPSIG